MPQVAGARLGEITEKVCLGRCVQGWPRTCYEGHEPAVWRLEESVRVRGLESNKMKYRYIGAVAGALGSVFMTGLAQAEEKPIASTAEESQGHASGFMLQGRVQAQGGLLSLTGGPGFLLGYRGPSFALGLGLGLTRIGISTGEGGDTSASLSLFQVVPTAMIDVWRSADGRA